MKREAGHAGRKLSLVLCSALSLTLLNVSGGAYVINAAAEESCEMNIIEDSPTFELSVSHDTDEDSLYNYMLTQSGVVPQPDEAKNENPVYFRSGISAGSRFTGNDKIAYDYLKTQIQAIAAGQRTDTVIEIPLSLYDVKTGPWSSEDLGVDVYVNGSYNEEAVKRLRSKVDFNASAVVKALLADCPYDLYWCDKSTFSHPSAGVSISYRNGEYFLNLTKGSGVKLYVAVAYSASGESRTTTVSSDLGRVATAINRAQEIVNTNSDKRGKDLLAAYSNAICSATDYNNEAADSGTAYGDPWQLIYVFDGDPSTNVVCEGYAKAFKYLCDLSGSRLKNISCLIATGTTSGPHMWNIVNMDDNRSYLVDVTQLDGITRDIPEYKDTFFLARPSSGTYDTTYSFYFPGASFQENGHIYSYKPQTFNYTYDTDTIDMYDANYIMLSGAAYTEPAPCVITIEVADINGIKTTATVNDIADYQLTAAPYLDGYDFKGWTINGTLYPTSAAAMNAIAAIAEAAETNTTIPVKMTYQKKFGYYKVTVKDGTLASGNTSGCAQVSNILTVKADAAQPGKKFSHWLKNGLKVSTNSTYSFRMPSYAVTLIAVYVDDTSAVEQTGTAIIESVTPNASTGKVSFVSVLNVPTGCTMVKGGLVATSNGSIGENVTAANAAYVKLSTVINANTKNLKYTWTKSGVTAQTVWYVRGYLVYKDANGVEKTVYSDCVKANINGLIST